MHVLIISSMYKTQENPIYGSFVEDQVDMLISKGNKVGVISPQWNGSFLKKPLRKSYATIDEKGVPIFYVYSKSIVPRFTALNIEFVAKKVLKAVNEYIDKFGVPDILHAHSVGIDGYSASQVKKKFRIKYIITEHSIRHPLSSQTQLDYTINGSEKIINVSNYQQSRLIETLEISKDQKEKFIVVPNMLNDLYVGGYLSPDLNKSKFVYSAVGDLVTVKNYGLLVRAFSKVQKEGSNCHLYIGGEGDEAFTIKKLITELGLKEHVTLLGRLSREEVKDLILKSDIIVSSSVSETFGIILIESLACGRPVVSTDSGGCRDIITKNNGLISPENSAEALAKEMIEIKNNIDQYDFRQIARETQDKYYIEVSKKLVSLFNCEES